MAPYVLLALYTLLFIYLYQHQIMGRKAFLVFVLVPAALLLGFRGSSVGEDTAMYLRMANVSSLMPWRSLSPIGSSIIWEPNQWGYGSSVDPGFLLYCKVIMTVFNDPQAVLCITAALTCLLIGVFIERNAKNVGQAYWFFLCGGLYMFAFNGMRQMFALAIAVNYYQLARRGKWGWAIMVILVASLLHRSALVVFAFLGLQLIMRLRHTYTVSIVVACLLPAIVQIAFPLVQRISGQYASYYSTNFWSASFGGVTLVWILIICCGIILGHRRRDDEAHGFLSVCDISYVMLELTAASISIIERVALYPLALVCISYDCTVRCVSAKNRWWVSLGGGLLLLALYLSYAASPAREYILCF